MIIEFFSNTHIINIDLILRALLALIIGFILGFEREYRAKPAGIKTYAMICFGSTIFTYVSINISIYADPSRIAAQIVSGLGFIGAGTIFQSKRMITGLTTAATLWVVGSLGVLVGLGLFSEAIICMMFIYLYFLMTRLAQTDRFRKFRYNTSVTLDSLSYANNISNLIKKHQITVITKSINTSDGIKLSLTYIAREKNNQLFISDILETEGVQEIAQ